MKNNFLYKKRNKILLFGISLVIVLFVLELNSGIFFYVSQASNAIKSSIASMQDSVSVAFKQYFNQADEIERLKNIEKEKEYNEILILALQDKIKSLTTLLDINQKPSLPHVSLLRAYSYVNMGQYSQIWLQNDTLQLDENRIFGLIRNNATAGIALNKNGNILGILNEDSKVSYGVYIGEHKAIGIFKNDLNGNAVIEYINAWSDIKEGDEVITSGLDDIFFEGIKVGKISKVKQEYGYIVAEVDLYNKNNDIGYFWLIDTQSNQN